MSILDKVKDYYGKTLKTNKDLKTNACCTPSSIDKDQKEILEKIHPKVKEKYYGCGLLTPENIIGNTILDLGSGSGRDVYMLSAMVGENGKVIGIDMTDEQLETARSFQDYHAQAFGHSKSNVTFIKGTIEDLSACGIEDESIDLLISNCVINLSNDKPSVYKEIQRVLKPGGEMLISDVFSNKSIPQNLKDDEILYGECLSGALSEEEFKQIMETLNAPYTIKNSRILSIENKEIEEKCRGYIFYSQTIQAQKPGKKPCC